MGYDVHITRAPEAWLENAGHEISEAEWLSLVGADPELRPATPEDAYYTSDNRLMLWSGANFEGPWLCWEQGNVYSKSPNAAMIAKMVTLAAQLNARVQGDDQEVYLPDGRVLGEDGKFIQGADWRVS